jgi:arylsulfatase A-like enzyme
MMRLKLKILAAMCVNALCLSVVLAEQRPNFIVFLTDDQRPDTLRVYNDKSPIKTPHLTRLADEGIRFEQGFVVNPICVASRANILTGCYSANCGVYRFHEVFSDAVFQASYPMQLKRAGYFVGALGKYGVGVSKSQKQAFDVFRAQSGQGPAFREYHGKKLHDAEWLTQLTAEFIDAVPKGQPFCLQINYKEPHMSSVPAPEDDQLLDEVTFARHPSDTPEQYATLPPFVQTGFGRRCYFKDYEIDGSIDNYMRQYHEKIVSVDRSVGKIRAMLKKHALEENTVLIFLSDHGTHWGEKQLSGKWTPYDPSLRIPFMVFDPRLKQRGRVDTEHIVLSIDIAPTLLDLAGVPAPEVMDGKSITPLVRGEEVVWRDTFSFEHFTTPAGIWYIPRSEGIRIGDLKYMRWIDQEPAIEELYDLERDPDETTNLIRSSEYAEKLSHLRRAFAEWRVANPHQYDPMPYSKRPEALAKSIDWVRFKTAHPEQYAKIKQAVEKLGVTWDAALNDWSVRFEVCKTAGYWY